MRRPCILVLGCDLSSDGSELGLATVKRLERALEIASHYGGRLVLAAGFSPRPQHKNQTKTMAEMMAAWLEQHCFSDVIVMTAKLFNTRGELEAACALDDLVAVVGGEDQIDRARDLVKKINPGREQKINFYSAPGGMTKKGGRLEPLKRLLASSPFWFQNMVVFVLHKVPGIRSLNVSF